MPTARPAITTSKASSTAARTATTTAASCNTTPTCSPSAASWKSTFCWGEPYPLIPAKAGTQAFLLSWIGSGVLDLTAKFTKNAKGCGTSFTLGRLGDLGDLGGKKPGSPPSRG